MQSEFSSRRTTTAASVNTSSERIAALRLDYENTKFCDSCPHVVLETKMTAELQQQAGIPRAGGYLNGAPNEVVLQGAAAKFPNTNNGLIASVDGRPRPEHIMRNATNMPTGQTFMRFRDAQGNPIAVMNPATNATASDWMLVPDPSMPTGYRWAPATE